MKPVDQSAFDALKADRDAAQAAFDAAEAKLVKARRATERKDAKASLETARTQLAEAVAAVEGVFVGPVEPGPDKNLPTGVASAEELPGATGPAAPATIAAPNAPVAPVVPAPAADVPAAAAREAAAQETARATERLGAALTPHGSPVHPAGADPAGALMEGQRDAAMQSPAVPVAIGVDFAAGPVRTGLHRVKDGEAVRISAKRAGFRRAGLAHPATPVDHPAGVFSEDEILALEREPMLFVQRRGRGD